MKERLVANATGRIPSGLLPSAACEANAEKVLGRLGWHVLNSSPALVLCLVERVGSLNIAMSARQGERNPSGDAVGIVQDRRAARRRQGLVRR